MFRVKGPKTSKWEFIHFDKVGPFSLYNPNLSSNWNKTYKDLRCLE
jgi:hypothetical protein